MVVTTLNAAEEPWAAPALLDPAQLASFADIDIVAAGRTYPAHRAVLAAHSAFFKSLFLAPLPTQREQLVPRARAGRGDEDAARAARDLHEASATLEERARRYSGEGATIEGDDDDGITPVMHPSGDRADPSSLPPAPRPGARVRDSEEVHVAHAGRDLHAFAEPDVGTPAGAGYDASVASAAGATIDDADDGPPDPPMHTADLLPPLGASSSAPASSAALQGQLLPRPSPVELVIQIPEADDTVVLLGWELVYRYVYGLRVALAAPAALAALQVATAYQFDDLCALLHAFLRGGGVDPAQCTRIFAAAATGAADPPLGGAPRVLAAARDAAWRVMKERFVEVTDWHILPLPFMVRLLKLNDLAVPSETDVFRAVEAWVRGGSGNRDPPVVASLVKLVRFPTMSLNDLLSIQSSSFLTEYPVAGRYVRRGVAAHATPGRLPIGEDLREVSPVYRRRRMDALTFSDRVAAWTSVSKPVHTSARYFAGVLWHLVVDRRAGGASLFLGVLSEESAGAVDITVDFAVFFVAQGPDGEQVLVRKQARGVRFARSGQRAGFCNIIEEADLDAVEGALVQDDTVYIGASVRLRGCKGGVAGLDKSHGDDTAEMLTL